MSEYEDKIKISFDTNADQTKQQVDEVAKAVNKTTDAIELQASAMALMKEEVKKATAELNKISKEFGVGSAEAKKQAQILAELKNKITESTTATEKKEVAQSSLRQQLRNANMELQNTINKYGETSKEAIASAKAVANLKDQMEFAQQLSKSFNPDQKFKALTSASQLAGTGLQGVTSGMALFGDQSKDTQAQLLKVQAAMAFSDAISNLSNVADQWKVLKTSISQATTFQKANNAVTGTATILQNAFTGSVNTTSFGFKALKVAIASTGIGLLVTGVALLVNNFDSLKAILFKAVPQLENVGKSIMGIVNAVTDFLGFTSEAQRLQDKMLAKANKSIKDNEYLLDVNANKYDEYTKRKIQANINYNKKVDELNQQFKDGEIKTEKEKNARVKAFREKANQEILQADIDRAKANEKAETKTIEKKEKSNKIVEKQEDEHAKAILSKEAELKKQLEDLQDNTEQKKLDRQKQRDAKEIELLGATGKQKQDLLLNLDKIYIEKQNELNAKIETEDKDKRKTKFEEQLNELKNKNQAETDYKNAKNQAEADAILNDAILFIEKTKEAEELKAEELGGTDEEKQIRRDELEKEFNALREEEWQRHADAQINIEKAIADQKKEINDRMSKNADQLLNNLAQGQIKSKGIQRAAIIAEGGVALGRNIKNTASAVTTDLKLGFPQNIAPVALDVATGALSAAQIVQGTQKALQALGTGGSVSGGATPQAPQGVSAQPQVGVQASSENQIATSIARSQAEQPPIKAFVVSTEVSSAQVLDAKLIAKNSF